MIPKKIYLTHEKKEDFEKFKKCIKYSQSKNPSYKIRMYTEKMRSRFIKKHFPEFYKYYIRINSNYGAAKADIWRVLILYKYGGIYIDCKSKLNNLDEMFKKNPNYDFYTVQFNQDDYMAHLVGKVNNMEYSNWFLATKARGQVITKIKNQMLKRLINYGRPYMTFLNKVTSSIIPAFGKVNDNTGLLAVFYYTGPLLFTYCIKKLKTVKVCIVTKLDKKYVIYNSNIPLLVRLIKHSEDYKNSYHKNKLPFLKDENNVNNCQS